MTARLKQSFLLHWVFGLAYSFLLYNFQSITCHINWNYKLLLFFQIIAKFFPFLFCIFRKSVICNIMYRFKRKFENTIYTIMVHFHKDTDDTFKIRIQKLILSAMERPGSGDITAVPPMDHHCECAFYSLSNLISSRLHTPHLGIFST